MKYKKISKNAQNYIRTVIFCIIILIIFILNSIKYLLLNVEYIYSKIYVFIPKYIQLEDVLDILIISICCIGIILVSIIPKIVSKNYNIYIDKYYIKIRSGVIYKNVSIVLLKDVYKVSLSKKIIGRIFKISSIILYTSAGNIKIKYLDEKSEGVLFNNITYSLKNYEGE